MTRAIYLYSSPNSGPELGSRMSFEEAKQFLRAAPEGGQSLYDHLAQTLLAVVTQRADESQFEEISSAIRGLAVASPSPLAASKVINNFAGCERER